MARLSRADMEAALAFAAEVGSAASQPDRADAWILEEISRMIGYEVGDYSHHGDTRSPLHAADYPTKPGGTAWTDHDWEVIEAEHPFCLYSSRTGDRHFSARRVTDVVDMRAFRRTEALQLLDYPIRPHALQMRTAGESGTVWQLNLARGGRNFSARECLMLDALRSPLIAYESHRVLAATLADLRAMPLGSPANGVLSRRENEVLDLVAEGASNARIAERLWISPGTVKKHLERIYLKLEVGSRTAALARTGRSLAASIPPESNAGIRGRA